MPDENLLSTLEQGLRHSRATRSRLAARLADLEAEAERVRTELNEMDAIISQTEAAMFRILSSSFSAQAGHASDAEIEYALRRDSVVNASRPVQPQTHAAYAPPPPAPPQDYVFRHQIPPIRAGVEQKSDRFFERTIPQATAVLLRESGGPLHVNEIYNRLLEGGFQFTGHNPTISIAVSLNRNRRFRKVAPGTFDLVIRDAAQAS
ncbi:MAG: hypothetical protein DMF67_00465 [Acidobacteria bacterium]|nr:MAG: hypothetical protein DMF66_07830 [Acidobacteriota bacterium]PYS85459.1 MAG: hypothetical protein DMF67_00465 [Acidobacteriota bacterium]